MRYLFLFVTCITSLQLSFAQNLVPNPSFEEVDSLRCYSVFGDYGDPILENYVRAWTTPTGGTSDIYSVLVPDSCTANPQRLEIEPKTGDNIVGIYTAEAEGDYREYLQVKLHQSLESDKSYYAEMYVLRNPESPFAGNHLGIYFSETEVKKPTEFRGILDFNAQIEEEEIIVETQQWQRYQDVLSRSVMLNTC